MAMTQSTIVFDTHEAVHQLTAAGVPERQAEAHVRLQAQLIEQNFATKADIESLGRTTKADIDSFRQATKADFDSLRRATKADIDSFRQATKADFDSLRRATKADIDSFRHATKADFDSLRHAMKAEIEALDLSSQALAAELRTEMANVKTAVADKLTDHFRWLIGIQVGVAAILLAAIKLF